MGLFCIFAAKNIMDNNIQEKYRELMAEMMRYSEKEPHSDEEKEEVLEQDRLIRQEKQIRKLWTDRKQKETELFSSWLRYLVSTGAVVLGILVAFHSEKGLPFPTRLCYVVAVVLLALSILFFGIALYSELYHQRKGTSLLDKQIENIREGRQEWRPITIPEKKIFGVFAKIGYVFSGLSILALCAYMILQI